MFQLSNDELRIDLLDPLNDAPRLGPRFCWGGYIWQAHDTKLGPLVSGPEFPKSDPASFNGQGLPESFRHRTLEGQPLTWYDNRGVALGAGELRRDHADRVELVEPCRWKITTHSDHVEFNTKQTAAGFSYALTRRVELSGRNVRSITRLTNLSEQQPLVLEWFAHPFFALVDGLLEAKLPDEAALENNPGFVLDNGVLRQRRRFTRIDDGHMERSLRLEPNRPLVATVMHPLLTHVQFETSFAPDTTVIWGNDRTFSLEPYLGLHLAPGHSREWGLIYRFGARSGTSSPTASSRKPVAR